MRTVELTQGKVALVDDEDWEQVNQHKWYYGNRGYAVRTVRLGDRHLTILLHRVILGLLPGDGIECDHKNGNRLDDRRENLRVATRTQNQHNRGLNRQGSSRFKGWPGTEETAVGGRTLEFLG